MAKSNNPFNENDNKNILGTDFILDEETGELKPTKKKKKTSTNNTKSKSKSTTSKTKTSSTPKKSVSAPKISSSAKPKLAKTEPKTTSKPKTKPPVKSTPKSTEPKNTIKTQTTGVTNVRSAAAKKAQETIKKKMQEDAEYAARMKEIRSNAAKKAAQTRAEKKKQIEEQKQDEEWEKIRQEEPEYYDWVVDNSPRMNDTIIENVKNQLMATNNQYTASFLVSCIDEQIDFEGEDAMIERWSNMADIVLECAFDVARASTQEDLIQYAGIMYYFIYGESVSGFGSMEIERYAEEDIPYIAGR